MIVTVDTGGTKTLISSFTKSGKIGKQIVYPTPRDPVKYTQLLRQALESEYGSKKVDIIVIALPGIIDDHIARWCPNLGWKNFDVRTALGKVLGGAPIYVENDANLAGLAEARLLSPTPDFALYTTISTGIGTGFISKGKIDPGLEKSEGGHALVEYDGKVREWESFASGRAIKETYGKFARDITSKRAWNHIADRISRGFLAVIPITQPDVIIFGGSVGTYFDRYATQLAALLDERLPAHITRPTLLQAQHPEHAVIYGGYYYACDVLAHQKSRE
ncbi:MAG: ROK family protein [Candidatus Saccharibacteria bacterium GW2011_GWC2_48_9]|nr:MAG: ROK family protein [Candidatus Saccharibacteria bacterium GW2011_GWC2_48_9]HCH34573.1 ROK family protein [Candidatus Saccharibacteria bacterium]